MTDEEIREIKDKIVDIELKLATLEYRERKAGEFIVAASRARRELRDARDGLVSRLFVPDDDPELKI